LDTDSVGAGLYRVLLHAWTGEGVQCDSGGRDRGFAGDCDARVGPAIQCDGEYAICRPAGDATGLRALRANDPFGVEVLFGLWCDAVRRDTGRPYWVVSGLAIVRPVWAKLIQLKASLQISIQYI